MANIIWKYRREYLAEESINSHRLYSILNDLLCGQYDREWVNVESICRFYNYMTLRVGRLHYSLFAVINSWLSYEKAFKILNPKNNIVRDTTEMDNFFEAYCMFEPRTRDGFDVDDINCKLFNLSLKRGSLWNVIEYGKMIGMEDFVQITSNVVSRYHEYMIQFGLTTDDFIKFSEKYPNINMNTLYEIYEDIEDNCYKFIDVSHNVLGILTHDEISKFKKQG